MLPHILADLFRVGTVNHLTGFWFLQYTACIVDDPHFQSARVMDDVTCEPDGL